MLSFGEGNKDPIGITYVEVDYRPVSELSRSVQGCAEAAGFVRVEDYVLELLTEVAADYDFGAPAKLTVENATQLAKLRRERLMEDSFEPGDDFTDQLRGFARGLRDTRGT